MDQLPMHKASQLSDFGLRIRRMSCPPDDVISVTGIHRNDYYIFGVVESGSGSGFIDFKEQHFSPGEVFMIQPGQAHRLISPGDAEGWLLFVDSGFVGEAEKCIFDYFSLSASSFMPDIRRRDELAVIASILEARLGRITDKLTKATARRLAEAFVGIVAEAVQEINMRQTSLSRRHMEIVLTLRRRLSDNLTTSRQPSFYASLLNISPVYLNEVVKGVTGMSTTSYIKNALVLRAKRLLVHTDLSVKEISDSLGIDDYAYFSRLFTNATGISPKLFRKRNLE